MIIGTIFRSFDKSNYLLIFEVAKLFQRFGAMSKPYLGKKSKGKIK